MELEFRPDVEAVRQQWDDFWHGRNTRPLFYAVRPKPGKKPLKLPRVYESTFGNVDDIIDRVLAATATYEYLADTIPSFQIAFAPDHFSALLGCDIEANPYSGDTMWVHPFVKDWDDTELRFQREGYWWQRTLEFIGRFKERCDGKLFIYGPQLQGNLDALASVRGTEQLLTDVVMAPEKVHRALQQVDRALAEVRTALAEALEIDARGTINRFGMYCPGRMDIPQSDISCMVSNDMFREFILPSLKREIAGVAHSIYHLDGPDALHHLDDLCAIPDLDMIQWQPGAAHWHKDWTHVYQRIDQAGKGQPFFQHISARDKDQIRHWWRTLASRQLTFEMKQLQPGEELDPFLDELAAMKP